MPKTIINKTVYDNAKKALQKLKPYGTTANKLKAVISAYDNGIKKVSEVFDVHHTSIHRWAKQIRNGEIDALINNSKHKEGIRLKNHHKEAIAKWLKKDPNLSIKEVKAKLEGQFNLSISKSTAHRAMKSSGFSYITPRKKHYKQNKEEAAEFKKN